MEVAAILRTKSGSSRGLKGREKQKRSSREVVECQERAGGRQPEAGVSALDVSEADGDDEHEDARECAFQGRDALGDDEHAGQDWRCGAQR